MKRVDQLGVTNDTSNPSTPSSPARPSNPAKPANPGKTYSHDVWLLDLALALLGVLVLVLVARILRFDDPRLLQNAWTYFLAVPTVLIGSAMLARVAISEQTERSIQAGFLISVLVHLGLTYIALSTILFTGTGTSNDPSQTAESAKKQLQDAARASSFFSANQAAPLDARSDPSITQPTKPDFLRPVEVDQTPDQEVDLKAQSQAPVALERLERERFDLPLDPTLTSDRNLNDTERAKVQTELPEIAPQAAEMAMRPDANNLNERTSDPANKVIPFEDVSQSQLPSETLAVTESTPLQRNRESMREDSRITEPPSSAFSQILSNINPVIAKPTPQTPVSESVNRALDQTLSSSASSIPPEDPATRDGLMFPKRNTQLSQNRINNSPIPIPKEPNVTNESNPSDSDTLQPNPANSSAEPLMNRKLTAPDDLATMLAEPTSSDKRRAIRSIDQQPLRSPAPVGAPILTPAAPGPAETGLAEPNLAEISAPKFGRSGPPAMRSGAARDMSVPLSDVGSAIGTIAEDLNQFRRSPGSTASGYTGTKGLVPIPAPAFEQRMRRTEDLLAGESAGEGSSSDLQAMGPLGRKTETAIERGLEFLAKYQRADGSWHLEDYGRGTLLRSDTAATALALLSFQGAGYSHLQAKHQETCRKALNFLIAGQRPDGDLYRPMDNASDRNAWLYSHAIGALALCEAFGMTHDENLRSNAQRAIDFLVASQDPREGGWRYAPRTGSDTSVTGWAMMALKSAELSGLTVPQQTYDRIEQWLENSQASATDGYLYRYNYLADTPETKHGTVPTPVMTSVGLLMRLYLGWNREHPMMARGSDWLLGRPPSLGTELVPKRDTYYWYYATQVLYHAGGERWKSWYESLYPILVDSQVTQGVYAGSWDPDGPIPDAWGAYAGRLYVTTMNLLSLEVTYRHLPIYEAAAR